ncbi:MAG: AAA family ATPase, partial [Peptostreptococcus sp.]|nr:AAA family ATPase [Peptostreptococcus sp.]
AVDRALADIDRMVQDDIPSHLLDAHYRGAKALGHGQGYKYPHAYQDHYVDQQYLPDNMVDKVYYEPQANKFEGQIRDFMNYLKGKKAE